VGYDVDRLTSRDVKRLVTFLEGAYAVHDLDALIEYVIHGLPALIPSAITSYNEINPRRRRIVWRDNPGVTLGWPAGRLAFERHMLDHPLIAYYRRTGHGGAYKISDFVTRRQFHRLALYQEFFRHLDGGEYQMCVALPAPLPLVVGVALNRSHQDFTERERLLFNLLRPHLVQAYHNAEAISDLRATVDAAGRALATVDRALIVASPRGRIRVATDGAVTWLGRYFNEDRPWRGDRLPDTLLSWARRCAHDLGVCDDAPPARQTLVVRGPGGVLVLRLACERARWVLLLEQRRSALDPALLEGSGLTPRETEVLGWVAQGKRDGEIAAILGARPRTVSKHVERILAKLGVETRTAAALRAVELARDLGADRPIAI
jgi:DNA-binding CsgD family transcriptional regulator